jgi:hypothetical protein
MPSISSYKSVDNTVQQIIDGSLFNGIANFTFNSGETVKYMLLEIPADVACQFLVQGLTLVPFDNTLVLELWENITTLTAGTPPSTINLNRNFPDIPICHYTINPVGVYGGEGTLISDFKPYIRQNDFPQASNILKDKVERLFKANKKYLFKFTRAADTNVLNLQFRWLWYAY